MCVSEFVHNFKHWCRIFFNQIIHKISLHSHESEIEASDLGTETKGMRKPVFGVSDLVRHKPSCTETEDGWRLEISYLGRREIVLSV